MLCNYFLYKQTLQTFNILTVKYNKIDKLVYYNYQIIREIFMNNTQIIEIINNSKSIEYN